MEIPLCPDCNCNPNIRNRQLKSINCIYISCDRCNPIFVEASTQVEYWGKNHLYKYIETELCITYTTYTEFPIFNKKVHVVDTHYNIDRSCTIYCEYIEILEDYVANGYTKCVYVTNSKTVYYGDIKVSLGIHMNIIDPELFHIDPCWFNNNNIIDVHLSWYYDANYSELIEFFKYYEGDIYLHTNQLSILDILFELKNTIYICAVDSFKFTEKTNLYVDYIYTLPFYNLKIFQEVINRNTEYLYKSRFARVKPIMPPQ